MPTYWRRSTIRSVKVRKAVLYGRQWQKAAALYKAEHPLCVNCLSDNITNPSEEVDHIVPHGGDPDLFWDEDNWQALCRKCHQKKHGGPGYSRKPDVSGQPVDREHPWYG